LLNVAGADELGRDVRPRVERLAAALTAAGLAPTVGGTAGANVAACDVAIACLTVPLMQHTDDAARLEIAAVLRVLGKGRLIAVAMEPRCTKPFSDAFANTALGAALGSSRPIDLSADGALFDEGVQDLVADVLMTNLQPSVVGNSAAAARQCFSETAVPEEIVETEGAVLRARKPSEVKAKVAAVQAAAASAGASPTSSPARRAVPPPPASPSTLTPAAARAAALAAEEKLEGITRPSEVKAMVAAKAAAGTSALGLPSMTLPRRLTDTTLELSQLSVTDVRKLFCGIGLAKYAPQVVKAKVSGTRLAQMDEAGLEALGMGQIHRRNLLGRLERFNESGVPAALLDPVASGGGGA